MRLFKLSNHAQQLAEQAQTDRENLDVQALRTYLEACSIREQRSSAFKARLLASISRLQVGTFVSTAANWSAHRLSARPKKPRPSPVLQREQIWRSGQHGEEIASQYLSRALPDEWFGVSGYKNIKGEVNLILVSPQGMVCLEIKYLNATVHCLGDEWSRDKFDRFGNLVESGRPIHDMTGRSPARQLLEPCAALAEFIESWGLPFYLPTWTAVLLTHANSRVGQTSCPTVDFVGRLDTFLQDPMMRALQGRTPTVNVPVIVELLHMHHRLCEKRQSRTKGEALT